MLQGEVLIMTKFAPVECGIVQARWNLSLPVWMPKASKLVAGG